MVRKSFKEVLQNDVDKTFMNVDEFGDIHMVDGKEMTVIVDENEAIERLMKGKSNMDGVYVRQKLIYVKASEFGALPAQGRTILFDGKRYLVQDAINEQGVYSITLELNKAR